MNSTLDNSPSNIFSAFIQLLNWKQVDSIVDEQPVSGRGQTIITTRLGTGAPGAAISGYEQFTSWGDRSGNKYRVFESRSTSQIAIVSNIDGVQKLAVASIKQMNDFFEFAQTLENE